MELVQSPIYTDSDLQALHTLVLPLLLQNSGQPCPTEPGSPCGNHPTHLLDDDAVVTRAVQPQLLQDAPHLEEGQAVTAQGSTRSSGSGRAPAPQTGVIKGNGATSALTPSSSFKAAFCLNSDWNVAPAMPFAVLGCIPRGHEQQSLIQLPKSPGSRATSATWLLL